MNFPNEKAMIDEWLSKSICMLWPRWSFSPHSNSNQSSHQCFIKNSEGVQKRQDDILSPPNRKEQQIYQEQESLPRLVVEANPIQATMQKTTRLHNFTNYFAFANPCDGHKPLYLMNNVIAMRLIYCGLPIKKSEFWLLSRFVVCYGFIYVSSVSTSTVLFITGIHCMS